MKTVAAWLAEYNQILDTATPEHSTPEEVEANLRAFRQRLAAAPGDLLDKLDVLNGMTAAMIAWFDRQSGGAAQGGRLPRTAHNYGMGQSGVVAAEALGAGGGKRSSVLVNYGGAPVTVRLHRERVRIGRDMPCITDQPALIRSHTRYHWWPKAA